MPLVMGASAPVFEARTHDRPDYGFGCLGGVFVLLAFLPDPGQERDAADRAIIAHLALFGGHSHLVFGVVRDEADFRATAPQSPQVRYFHDPERAIARLYGLVGPQGNFTPQWVALDPMMRVLFSYGIDRTDEAFEVLARFRNPEAHAGTRLHAPVLIVPRVFEPDLCRKLIDAYRKDGGEPSGTMRDIGVRTVGVLDDFKRRRDAVVSDETLKSAVRQRIAVRLAPQIAKSFMFQITHMERYIVARYDSADGGYFRPHRDNTTLATAHRQFACSINLNAEEFDGGDLRFPEFGRGTYRPPTGGAVIFSCALLHEALPVTAGERFAFLPFFYDEAAARIRQENAAFLTTEPGEPARSVHPKAMGVVLTSEEEREVSVPAPREEAKALQRALPDDTLSVIKAA